MLSEGPSVAIRSSMTPQHEREQHANTIIHCTMWVSDRCTFSAYDGAHIMPIAWLRNNEALHNRPWARILVARGCST